MDAVDTLAAVRRGDTTAAELVEAALARVERLDPLLNAVVTRLPEAARSRAAELDRLAQEGRYAGQLHGLPVLVKDLFDPLAGVRNTMGCSATAGYVPDTTAVHLQRLIDAGAVVIGKTNVPEFGHKGTTDNKLFGPTCCPFDLTRNAGGSSGGSAAAVAAGMTLLAQGSDAGGSIRIPAAWCGVVGLKLSYGRIPNTGNPNAFASHTPFVHTGPLATTVRDAALAASVMSGPHPADPFSLPPLEEDLVACATEKWRPIRVAFSPTFGGFPVEDSVADVVRECVEDLRRGGVAIDETPLRFSVSPEEMTSLWRRQVGLAYAEMFAGMSASGGDFLSDHADAIPAPIHESVEAARKQSALDARRDESLRSVIFRELQAAFESTDLLLTPTLATPPVVNAPDGTTVGPSEVSGCATDPTLGWCLTHPINFTGHPAVSIPAGQTPQGLPVGLQIIGRTFADGEVVAFAAEVERRRPWYDALLLVRERLEQASASV